jgi:hypothetical protein
MASADSTLLQPRSAGQILDEAWHLYQAEKGSLLVLSSLFLVPLFASLLWLVAMPHANVWFWPLITAGYLSASGIGSGACQELLRLRASGESAPCLRCLGLGFRRSLGHMAIRSLGMACIALGLCGLLLPGLLLWLLVSPLHAALVNLPPGSPLRLPFARELTFNPGKTAVVIWTRVPLLALATLNLVLLLKVGLWTLGNLGGVDVALLTVVLEPTNPVFLLAATLFAWLLLAPYFEAANFLLSLDTRVRQEGIDLLHRVQRSFAATRHKAAVVVGMALVLLVYPTHSWADEAHDTAHKVRAGVVQVRREIEKMAPYPGGARWMERLENLTDQLEDSVPHGETRYRWFRDALVQFAQRNQAGAIRVLKDLEARLAVVEDSLTGPGAGQAGPTAEEIRQLLPPRQGRKQPAKAPEKAKPPEKKAPPPEDNPQGNQGNLPPQKGFAPPAGPAFPDPSPLFWWLILGFVLLVAIAALVLGILHWSRKNPDKKVPVVARAKSEPAPPPFLPQEKKPADLLQQADTLAAQGNFKEAVRMLYLSVLSHLHRLHFLRYERTRTNGEYVREVRLVPTAPEELVAAFARLTAYFDQAWYGEYPNLGQEFQRCKGLAGEITAL